MNVSPLYGAAFFDLPRPMGNHAGEFAGIKAPQEDPT